MRMHGQRIRGALLWLNQTLRTCAQTRIGAFTNMRPARFAATRRRFWRLTRQGAALGWTRQGIGAFPNAPAAASTHTRRMALDTEPSPPTAAVGQRPTIAPTSPLREMGPVDYLVVEFPGRRVVSGEGLSMLLDLVDRRVIRILDLVFIGKESDGTVIRIDADDIARNAHPGLEAFDGASSGLLDQEDIDADAADSASPQKSL